MNGSVMNRVVMNGSVANVVMNRSALNGPLWYVRDYLRKE